MGQAVSAVKNVPDVKFLAAAVGLNLGVGQVLGLLAAPNILGWYKKLDKPKWTPPNAVFGPVWGVLYAAMGVASWMVFKQGGWAAQKTPLKIYGAQLAFNFAWQPLFFIAKRLDLALVDCSLLVASTAATGLAFAKVDKRAGAIFVPTFLWCSYACALNASLLKRNPDAHKIPTDDPGEEVQKRAQEAKQEVKKAT